MTKTSTISVWGLSASLTTLTEMHHDEAMEIFHRELNAMTCVASRFIPDSELSTLNATTEPFRVSDRFSELFAAALHAYAITDGACDPTALRALRAIGYDSDFAAIPVEATMTSTQPLPGLAAVSFDPVRNIVQRPANVQFDFGATAKALTCDRVAALVGQSTGVCVEIGGDVAVGGPCPPEGWVIGIAESTHITGREPKVAIRAGGIATSSQTERRWLTQSGTRHHIIDPRTGDSSTSDIAAISVSAVDCVTANAFATACIAWGEESVHALTQAGWSARVRLTNGDTYVAGGWPEDHA